MWMCNILYIDLVYKNAFQNKYYFLKAGRRATFESLVSSEVAFSV
jgi:hypothetical protein